MTANGITIAILAGGQSRRMGHDKTEIVLEGMTLLERTVRTARATGCSVRVIGRQKPEAWPLADVLFLPDELVDQGPISGLLTALHEANGQAVLALACDLPLLTTDALGWLIEAGRTVSDENEGLIVQNGEQWEPLFSLYHPSCVPRIETLLATGRRSLHALIESGRFAFLTAPSEFAAALTNLNTPADMARLPQTGLRIP